jgi:hypothetical protein
MEKEYKFTKEHREKLRDAKLGTTQSADHVAKRAAKLSGKPRSEETKAKISAALTGKPGRVQTEETKARISAALKARWNKA